MTARKFLLLAAAFVLTACGAPGSPNQDGAHGAHIFGGTEVVYGDLLGQYVVTIGPPGGGECSATLVAENLAITAAHCVDLAHTGRPDDSVTLYLKFRTPGNENAERAVDQVALHPAWTNTVQLLNKRPVEQSTDREWRNWGDVAVVHFQGGLPSGYAAAPLFPAGTTLGVGDRVVMAGFGASRDEGNFDLTLRKVEKPIAEATDGSMEVIFDQTDGRGTCKGDSGGPTFRQQNKDYFLFAVTSHAMGRPSRTLHELCRQFSAATDLSRLGPWLADTLRTLGDAN